MDFSHEINFDGTKIELYIHEIHITETLKIFALYVIFMVNIFSKCKLYWFRRRKTLPIIFNVNDIINFQQYFVNFPNRHSHHSYDYNSDKLSTQICNMFGIDFWQIKINYQR